MKSSIIQSDLISKDVIRQVSAILNLESNHKKVIAITQAFISAANEQARLDHSEELEDPIHEVKSKLKSVINRLTYIENTLSSLSLFERKMLDQNHFFVTGGDFSYVNVQHIDKESSGFLKNIREMKSAAESRLSEIKPGKGVNHKHSMAIKIILDKYVQLFPNESNPFGKQVSGDETYSKLISVWLELVIKIPNSPNPKRKIEAVTLFDGF